MKPRELRSLAVRLRRDRAVGGAALSRNEAHVVADLLQVISLGLQTWPATPLRQVQDALRDARDREPRPAQPEASPRG